MSLAYIRMTILAQARAGIPVSSAYGKAKPSLSSAAGSRFLPWIGKKFHNTGSGVQKAVRIIRGAKLIRD